jgi:predicted O-methyltransferase YrrM
MRVMPHLLLWSLGLAEAETQTSDTERDCLARHAKEKKCLVEIGVWHGVTTCRLLGAMASDGVLYAVDPYPAGRFGFSAQRLIARREVSRIKNGELHWVRATGGEAGQKYATLGAALVDFVFIDGDHSFEALRGDWKTWSPLVAPKGIVILHDSRSSAIRRIDDAGSVIYTNQIILHDVRFELVETVDTLTVLERKSSDSFST